MTTASDNFNRADGPIGSNWTLRFGAQAPYIVSNAAQNTFTAYADPQHVAYTGASWGTTYQRARVTINNIQSGGPYVGAAVFMSGSGGTYNGVIFRTSGKAGSWETNVFEYTNGTASDLFSVNQSFSIGDTIELEVDTANDVIRVYRNGAQIGSDYTYTRNFSSGQPGLYLYGTGAAADDWWATDGSVVVLDDYEVQRQPECAWPSPKQISVW